MKIDGVMVDTFTASAISQIYDKVSDAKMRKRWTSCTYHQTCKSSDEDDAENEFIPEGKMSQIDQMRKDGKSAEEIAKALKMKVKDIKKIMGEQVELGEDGHADGICNSSVQDCDGRCTHQIMAKLLAHGSRGFLYPLGGQTNLRFASKQHEQDERLYCEPSW